MMRKYFGRFLRPDVLEHADRADLVVRAVVDVAVVLQPDLHAVLQLRGPDPLAREFELLLRKA